MTDTEKLNINHHAHRVHHSTTTTILHILDQIYEATDKNLILTLITVAESNMFESVEHNLLTEKMELYNFNQDTIDWFKDYLSFRSSYVSISAKPSKMVTTGGPTGECIGTIIIHSFYQQITRYCQRRQLWTTGTQREDKLRLHLERTVQFLNRNKLNLNQEKTTISKLMTRQKRTRTAGGAPELTVRNSKGQMEHIGAQVYARLLGGNVGHNIGWTEHLIMGEKALLPRLRKQLGALKLLSKELPMRSKLLFGKQTNYKQGVLYDSGLGGGHEKILLRKVQTVINQTARFISGSNKWTRAVKLMKMCNWLNFYELVNYHSLVTLLVIVYRENSWAPGHIWWEAYLPQNLQDCFWLDMDLGTEW